MKCLNHNIILHFGGVWKCFIVIKNELSRAAAAALVVGGTKDEIF